MRQIVLDTETTGLDPAVGHRIIEIGCVEIVNRRRTDNTYHQYINPEREIDAAAIDVHGITNEFLSDKPRFADVVQDFLEFVNGAELIIHNASFDVGFINHELKLIRKVPEAETGIKALPQRGMNGLAVSVTKIEDACTIIDTLAMARSLHPGQKNDLDSLCKRYLVDNTQRTLHGALLDAEILADVYLTMTGGQTGLFEDARGLAVSTGSTSSEIERIRADRMSLPIISASPEELAAHQIWLEEIDKKSGGQCMWKRLDS